MLTDTKIKNAKPRERVYRIADRDGLCLEVRPNGSKLWRYRFRLHGKANMFAMGSYPEVGLRDAREALESARKLVSKGINPAHHQQTVKAQKAVASRNTFKAVAEEWIDQHRDHWTAQYLSQVQRHMKADVYPKLGHLPVRSINPSQILEILRKVEKRGAPHVAKLIRMWSSAVFRHAIATLRADVDPAATLRGAIKPPKVNHYTPLKREQIPDFLEKLEAYTGQEQTKICLKLMLYVFVRPSELRQAEWVEFDLAEALWRIPAERMKMREEHLVPLPRQAVELLKRLQALNGHRKHLFPNERRPRECMSPGTTNRALERMGYRQFTSHGFRATASTLLNEMNFRPDVIERQLAHKERNSSRAAYNRSLYLEERRDMLQQWADFVDGLSANANVVAFASKG